MISFATLSEFRRSRIFKHVTCVIILCFTVLVCNGCVSSKVRHLPITTDTETPSIAMKMYLEKPDAEEMDHIINGVQSNLYFKSTTGEFVQVTSSQNGQWILKNAPVGTYRLELAESFEYEGEIVELSGSRTTTFQLPADKRVEIQVILKKTPVGLIVVLSVVVVGLIILTILVADDLPDLPMPPPLPPLIVPSPSMVQPLPLDLFFPPMPGFHNVGPFLHPPLFIDYGVYIAPQVGTYSHAHNYDATTATEAVHLHPHDGAVDVSVSTNIEIFFSFDIEERCLQDSSILAVVGSESGPIPGEIYYTPSERKMGFEPTQPFVLGEEVSVYLDGGGIPDSVGRCMPSDYRWSFFIEDE